MKTLLFLYTILSLGFATTPGTVNTDIMKSKMGGVIYDNSFNASLNLDQVQMTYPYWSHSIGGWYKFLHIQLNFLPTEQIISKFPRSNQIMFRWHNSRFLYLYSSFGFETIKLNETTELIGPCFQSFTLRPWSDEYWISEQKFSIAFTQDPSQQMIYLIGKNALGKHIKFDNGYIIPMGTLETTIINFENINISFGFKVRIGWNGDISQKISSLSAGSDSTISNPNEQTPTDSNE